MMDLLDCLCIKNTPNFKDNGLFWEKMFNYKEFVLDLLKFKNYKIHAGHKTVLQSQFVFKNKIYKGLPESALKISI